MVPKTARLSLFSFSQEVTRQWLWDRLEEMYAFYSLLVYIFYTVLQEGGCGGGRCLRGMYRHNLTCLVSGGFVVWEIQYHQSPFFDLCPFCTCLGPFKNKMVFKEIACICHAYIQYWMARVLPHWCCTCVLRVSAVLWDLQRECKYFHHVSLSGHHAMSRSQHMFPWKQAVRGEMATPPRRRNRLVLGLVIWVSAP